jgi:cytochrome c oxidase subunit 2
MSRLLISMMLSGLGLLIATPTVFAEPDLANGQVKFKVCEACHGLTGSGSKEIGAPRIAGQNHWYERRQLQNFKAGIRGSKPEDTFGAVMRPMALTLVTDQDVEDVIAYFGTLKPEISQTLQEGAAKGKETTPSAATPTTAGSSLSAPALPASPVVSGAPDPQLQLRRARHARDVFGRQMGHRS